MAGKFLLCIAIFAMSASACRTLTPDVLPNSGSTKGVTASEARPSDAQIIKGMAFLKIPKGTMYLGANAVPSADAAREGKIENHRVDIKEDYFIQKTEVTRRQFKAAMGCYPEELHQTDSRCARSGELHNTCQPGVAEDDHPVACVSLADVQEFIKKLNGRREGFYYELPGEDAWEYATRGGTSTLYHFGDNDFPLYEYAWFADNSGGKTHPVGQLKANPSGLHDVYGNVWEMTTAWTGDVSTIWYRYFENMRYEESDHSIPPQGIHEVIVRGGSLGNTAECSRSAYRGSTDQNKRSPVVGFRLIRSTTKTAPGTDAPLTP